MNASQRDGVRDAARYLLEVRPLDPEELREYVEGRPSPEAVRRVLREQAVELGLVELDDGTFVPVGDEPAPPLAGPVSGLPERYDRTVETLLVERFGPDWATGTSGDRLRETVRRLKEDYYRGRGVTYDALVALGYAIYHLADHYAAVQYVLSDLAHRGLVDRSLRVLDVGAGVGGPALGLVDWLPDDALVEYTAVEPSPAAAVLEALLARTGPNVHWSVERTTAEAFEAADPFDVVLLANVLSELDEPARVATRYADAVADDGALVLIAPADLETATGLRDIERAVERTADFVVYAPTVRLWPGHQPTDRCWSFDVRPDLDVPTCQRALDQPAGATGEFVNVDVQFAYALLRPTGSPLLELTPAADRHAPLAESETQVADRVDCVAVKLSHDLADGGNPLYLVGDGSQRIDHFAVLAQETALNAGLREAAYGDGLVFERVLVLWNDDEAAYNLVVDDETTVDVVPARG